MNKGKGSEQKKFMAILLTLSFLCTFLKNIIPAVPVFFLSGTDHFQFML